MDLFVDVVVLLLMFMHLILFAALAPKNEITHFPGGRVPESELRADSFLDKYFTSFSAWRVSVRILHWKCYRHKAWGAFGGYREQVT